MRMHWAFAAAAFLAAAPAEADVTARFALGGGGGATMTVEVNDQGDSRTSQGSDVVLMTVDGTDYIVVHDPAGTFVARGEDWFAVQVEDARASPAPNQHPMQAPQALDPSAPTTLHPVRGGNETVGGRTGTMWTLRDSRGQPDIFDSSFVVSADADLAPVGLVAAHQMAQVLAARAQMGEDDMDGYRAGVAAIYALGTVIRQSGDFRLESVDTNPVPASEFVLPGPPLSRAQLAARLHDPTPH